MNNNVFLDQAKFMLAAEQSVGVFNEDQLSLYLVLIQEEVHEMKESIENKDYVNLLKELNDIIVVVSGAIWSLDCDPEDAWNEVVRSNMSKVDPEVGKIVKRDDGKVLKPSTYSPADVSKFIRV